MSDAAEPDGPGRITLAEILDMRAAGPLSAEFAAFRGHGVHVDAGQVRRLGAQCLQVLLAATASWRIEGADVCIVDRSEDFRHGLALFGAESMLFEHDAKEST